jgi:hypothetical protein
VLLGVLLLGGAGVAGAAPAATPQNRSAQVTPSTLVVDRTPVAPATPPAHSHLWVGLVIGVFGALGLVWSRAFRPLDRSEGAPGRSTR